MDTANTSIIQSSNIVLNPEQIGTVGSVPIFAFPFSMPAKDFNPSGRTAIVEIEKISFPKEVDILEQAKKYYLDHKEELIKKYKGKYIAIFNNKVIGSGSDFSKLALRVYTKYGYQTIFMPFVEKKEGVVKISSPRIRFK